jgi:hypothetical protein
MKTNEKVLVAAAVAVIVTIGVVAKINSALPGADRCALPGE